MRYINSSGNDAGDVEFTRQVRENSGVNFSRCAQCLTCTLGCPISFAMDYNPNQIVRMIQLGAKSEVLRSNTIWLCASCETCVTRCPYEVDIPRLMDVLRRMAVREKVYYSGISTPIFNRIFQNSIGRWGRQYELGMLLELKLRTKDLFSDVNLGMRLLLKGKLSLIPAKTKAHKEINDIIKKSEALD